MINLSKPKRRWYQYTLRSLFVLTTLVAVVCSWYAVEMQEAAKRRAAIEDITEPGGKVFYFDASDPHTFCEPPKWYSWLRKVHGDEHLGNADSVHLRGQQITNAELVHLKDLPNLRKLWLNETQVTDAGLEHLKGLTRIEMLRLSDWPIRHSWMPVLEHVEYMPERQRLRYAKMKSEYLESLTECERMKLAGRQITDAGLAHLKGLTTLKDLTIFGCDTQITDAGLEQLKGLTNLELLSLDRTQVTDAGLTHLKGLTKLRQLDLNSSRITDAGLVHLKGLTKLERLEFGGPQITDAGLVHLKCLTSLRWLDLGYTQVTNAGLRHLNNLTRLESLSLDGTKITDSGLVHLEHLTNLKKVSVENTQVTEKGVEKLQQALPNCKIVH